MLNALLWMLVVYLIGFVAFPLTYVVFKNTYDKGYSLSKILGLLLFSWIMWFSGSMNLFPSNTYTLWLMLGVLCICSIWLFLIKRQEITEALRNESHTIIVCELVFLSVYFFWIIYRFYDPFINTTEQPMDFAILNASLITDFFPPEDPWLSGHSVPYYYFGYLMMANLTELTSIPSSISYNLSLALIPSLSATAIFGLSYNLIRSHGSSTRRAIIFSLTTPFLLLFIGNLESVLEIMNFRGLGGSAFWNWIGIKDLGAGLLDQSWRPSEHMWWWRATRVIDTLDTSGRSLDYTISEFPFFSLILGDLHPHLMSIPFIILLLGVTLNTFMDRDSMDSSWIYNNKLTIFVTSLVLGALSFINIWDFVPFFAFWIFLLYFKSLRDVIYLPNSWIIASKVITRPVLLIAFFILVMYLPYYLSLDSQASGVLPVGLVGTRMLHFVIVWGLFLSILIPFLTIQIFSNEYETPRNIPIGYLDKDVATEEASSVITEVITNIKNYVRLAKPALFLASVIVAIPILVWVVWQLGSAFVLGSLEPILAIPWKLLRVVPLLFLTFTSLSILLRYLSSGGNKTLTFSMSVTCLALLLLFGPEFLRVDDLYHNRMNTVFKAYYQAWILLSIASSFALYRFSCVTFARDTNAVIQKAWLMCKILIVLMFAGSLYYPLESALAKTNDFKAPISLNGLAHIARDNPDEYLGIQWLMENVQKGDVLLEAVGQSWSDHGRISGSTGIPTVLGWPWHEKQWRGSDELFKDREENVRKIYSSDDKDEVLELIKSYSVRYIIVGKRETGLYGSGVLEQFSDMSKVVFFKGNMAIYSVLQ